MKKTTTFSLFLLLSFIIFSCSNPASSNDSTDSSIDKPSQPSDEDSSTPDKPVVPKSLADDYNIKDLSFFTMLSGNKGYIALELTVYQFNILFDVESEDDTPLGTYLIDPVSPGDGEAYCYLDDHKNNVKLIANSGSVTVNEDCSILTLNNVLFKVYEYNTKTLKYDKFVENRIYFGTINFVSDK